VTDSRPEITAKADGDSILVRIVAYGLPIGEWPISPQECFALQCQLSAAFQQVSQARGVTPVDESDRLEIPLTEPEQPETWRTREPLL